MANLRTIRKRITGVRNTMQLTRAMKMVAAAKLRRAQMRVEHARPYMKLLAQMIQAASGSRDSQELSPLQGEAEACLVFSSDRGLCGSYNGNILRTALKYREENPQTHFILFGKKIIEQFRKRDFAILLEFADFVRDFSWQKASTTMETILTQCQQQGVGKLAAIYTHFVSAGVQRLESRTLFPFSSQGDDDEALVNPMLLIEPSREQVLQELIRHYSRFSFYYIVAEVVASEHGARMSAMDAASRNAEEVIDRLTLEMNRARQTSITTELLEIIGGAEALA